MSDISIEHHSCEGYLEMQKKGSWKMNGHIWAQRFFTLKNDSLFYAKDALGNKKKLLNIEIDTAIYSEEEEKDDIIHYFIRIANAQQHIHLRVCDESSRNTWLASFLTVVTKKLMCSYPEPQSLYLREKLETRRASGNISVDRCLNKMSDKFWRRHSCVADKLKRSTSLFNLSSHSFK